MQYEMWVVVDPAFRTILRGIDGETLTRDPLANSAVFAAATRNIPKYHPNYTFEKTVHVRITRLGFMGALLRNDRLRQRPGVLPKPTAMEAGSLFRCRNPRDIPRLRPLRPRCRCLHYRSEQT